METGCPEIESQFIYPVTITFKFWQFCKTVSNSCKKEWNKEECRECAESKFCDNKEADMNSQQ